MENYDPFASAVIKIDRAREHIYSLEVRIADFLRADPYRVVGEEEPETGDLTWHVFVDAHPPYEWGAYIGDAIHNLRAALDHLVWRLVVDNDHEPTIQTMFPIAENEAAFNGSGLNRVKGISSKSLQILRGIRPYKEGNLRLWHLHRLDNVDKHRLIIPVGSAYHSIILDMSAPLRELQPDWNIPPIDIALRPARRHYPLRNGIEVFRVMKAARSGVAENPRFNFEIAFGEGEVIHGEPVLETLAEFVALVEQIVEQFRPAIEND